MQEQFRQAVGALSAGRPDEAVRLCEVLLAQHPGNTDVRHLLGVALLESGAIEPGRQTLEQAMAERPDDPEIPYNYGSALLKLGHPGEALTQFDRALKLRPDHVQARTNRATALLESDQFDLAVVAYREVLEAAPRHASAWFNLGNAQSRLGELEDALQAYRQALSLRPDYYAARLALGQSLLDDGRGRQAIEVLTPAARSEEADAEAWRLLAQALGADNRFEDAVDAARRATELDPADADNWNSYGAALTSLGRLEPSEAALNRALALEPGHRHATVNLAALLELSHRHEACAALTQSALADRPGDPGLTLTQARLMKRSGQVDEARALLEAMDLDAAAPQQRREARFLLGHLADAQGDAAAAWGHFLAGNQLAAQQWQRGEPAPDTILPAARRLRQRIDRSFVTGWPAGGDGQRQPAFILSFQRSGTTLLDTMLGAHPGTCVMEELPVINRVIARIGDYPEALRDATAAQLDAWRSDYFREAEACLGGALDPDVLLIDKSPLHSLHVALLHRLFPGAPIIFALRHPADVVLSCFMQDFTLSPFMLHYTTIEGVTAAYDRVMGLWQHYRGLLPLNVMDLRYETLVESPEAVLRQTLEFIGLPWDPAVMNYAEHARGRGLINTPSYDQVTRPVYRSSRGRWRRYAPYMQSVLPRLAPFCDAFDYPLDETEPQ